MVLLAGGVLLAAVGCVTSGPPTRTDLIDSPGVSPTELPLSGGTVLFSAVIVEAYDRVPMSVTVSITYPDGDGEVLALRRTLPGLREVTGVYLFPGNTTGGAEAQVFHTKITARTADGASVEEVATADVTVVAAAGAPPPPEFASEGAR